ncbi:MAG: hypothetical protein AABX98_02190, partial [Nanoarchaeota archaeon]
MIQVLDELLLQDEIAIHSSVLEQRAASAPPTPDPRQLEQLLRQDCRDLIAASYDAFRTVALENPLRIVYEVQKQQAIAALKAELRAKAAAATSAEERQMYLNYARVAHLQFAQKARQLDALVALYHQDVPEPQHYLCSTTGYGPSSSGVCGGLAALSMGLLGMASQRIRVKVARHNGVAGSPPSPTIVPPEPLSVMYSSEDITGDDGVIVDDDALSSNPLHVHVTDGDPSKHVDTSKQGEEFSRKARQREDGVWV